MKNSIKKRILSLVLCISMVLPMIAQPMPVHSVESEESIAPLTNPFTPETIITLPDGTTTSSQSYRIPSMVTLADGTIVAAADIRWNTTYDGGCLDTLVARSTDGGVTWSYSAANYLGDNGNEYNFQSTAFIDPSLTVAADGKTVYLLCDIYPYGIALNGNGNQKTPATDIGFTEEGYLKLSNNEHASYDYYLKDGYIYDSSNTQAAGFTVDAHFNLYDEEGSKVSNLFFADSPYKVVRTGFLYLISSTDGGATWSAPTLLDLKNDRENVCLASPGSGITTANGIMVFPVYSYTTQTQKLGFIFSSDNGTTWQRSADFDSIWASESAVVEIGEGILRFFFRNQTSALCYVDYDMNAKAWGGYVNTGVKTNSNTQLSAITYSKTFDGNQVVLVSCPTGPNEAGSANSDGSCRTNGKIFVGVVNAENGTMSWPKSIDVSPNKATAQLQDSNYTEEQGFFAYSCLTERSDGSIAILYENNQYGWGASNDTCFTINAKAYPADTFGIRFDVDANAIYEELMNITTWRAWESYVSGLDEDAVLALQSLPKEKTDNLDRISHYFYKEKLIAMAPPAVDYTDAAPLVSLYFRTAPSVMTEGNDTPVSYLMRASAPVRMATFSNPPALLGDTTEENGLILSKIAEKVGDKYKITLEAYTTGSVQTGEATPSDIVLVLDLSTSMKENFSESSYVYTEAYPTDTRGTYYLKNGQTVEWCDTCNAWTYGCGWFWHGTAVVPKTSADDTTSGHVQFYTRETVAQITRLEALKSAMESFIAQVADQQSADRIALVGFHEESVLLAGSSNAAAFMDATTYETTLLNAISGIGTGDLKGATEHGFGMERAVAVFNAQTSTDYTNRNKVVIMVTDGEPAPSGTGNWSSRTVKQAIEQSYVLKNSHNASVYTISVMPGTDASNPTSAMDKYMDYMSSNYPDARYTANSIDNRTSNGYSYYSGSEQTIVNAIVPGTKAETTGSYYLTAGNLDALNNIFGEIADQTGGAAIELDKITQIKDIVSPYFSLPDGATSNEISVSTMDAVYVNGVLNWKASTIQDFDPAVIVDGKNVTVQGFDFTHNFVAQTGRTEGDVSQAGSFHGRKLIITFFITPEPDFLGGDGVATNDASSGVYDKNGNKIEAFHVPTVNVPLKEIDTVAQDKHIYYGNTTDLTGILNLHVKESTSGKYLQDIANGVNNAYVDLVYDVTLNDNSIVTYRIPAGNLWYDGTWEATETDMHKVQLEADASYRIVCTMTSKNDSNNYKSAEKNANIHVYKPVLTFKDATKTPKEDRVAYDTENYVSTEWKNGSTLSTKVTMEGTAPKFTLTYTPDGNCIDGSGLVVTYDDFYVNVTVKLGDTDITSVVTFEHQGCDPDCSFNGGQGEFMIHVVKVLTSLTIGKEVCSGGETVAPNQSFLFCVEGEGVNLIVTVHGNGSTTVNGLKVGGAYTVTELTDWCWRYEFSKWEFVTGGISKAEGDINGAFVTLGTEGNTLTFTNTRNEEKWLDGNAYKDNRFHQD